MKVNSEDIKPGMVINTWFGTQLITEIKQYTGPFNFIRNIFSIQYFVQFIMYDN